MSILDIFRSKPKEPDELSLAVTEARKRHEEASRSLYNTIDDLLNVNDSLRQNGERTK